jgi:hypothetical protein
METVIDKAMPDFEHAMEELDKLSETEYHLLFDNLSLRAEVMIMILSFEYLHAVRKKFGVLKHEYTLTPRALLESLVYKED